MEIEPLAEAAVACRGKKTWKKIIRSGIEQDFPKNVLSINA